MKDRKVWFTAFNVALYVAGAAIIFAWLAIRASNGALFSASSGTYKTVVPSAPGIEPNKTEVLAESGVAVGVVTGLVRVPDGAEITFKVTGPVQLQKDATTRVVVRNIIGERSVMVGTGTSPAKAENGQTLKWRDAGDINEASDALDPLQDIHNIKQNTELQRFTDEQKGVVDQSEAETKQILADGKILSDMLSSQNVALSNIGRRSSELLDVLAAKGTTIDTLAAQTAALAKDSEGLLDDNLTVVDHGLDLATNTMAVVTRRQNEMNNVLSRLPEAAHNAQMATDTVIRLLNNEKGYYVYVGGTNLPDLNRVLQILKTGHQ